MDIFCGRVYVSSYLQLEIWCPISEFFVFCDIKINWFFWYFEQIFLAMNDFVSVIWKMLVNSAMQIFHQEIALVNIIPVLSEVFKFWQPVVLLMADKIFPKFSLENFYHWHKYGLLFSLKWQGCLYILVKMPDIFTWLTIIC